MPQIIRQLFEQEFKKQFNLKDAIAVNSGTSALIAPLWSMNLKPTDEVITTPFTFPATTAAIIIAGAKPVFVDIDPNRHLIDVNLIEAAITPNTKAILPVHLFGRTCDMDIIMEIAASNDLIVIEDTAQALGVTYWSENYNQPIGTIGDAGCFSFYKTKNLSTFEGGMIAIKWDSKLNPMKIRAIASPTQNKPRFIELGFNFRMPEPCALIGYERLKLHKKGIQAEIPTDGETKGFYPYLTYQLPFCASRGFTGNCPVAEETAWEIAKYYN